ncbi:MAG: OmpW/AlkL family protein [Mangrovicoccus sp.]
MTHTKSLIAVAMGLGMLALPVAAAEKGTWSVGVGVGMVQPKDDNGSLVNGTLDADVGDSVRPTFTLEYFVMDNVGIELLAATPFQHSVKLDGLGEVATVQHLPPTLSVNYHFSGLTPVTPFIGAGLNYTTFFEEKTKGALDGSKIRLGDSFGLALHAGLDFDILDSSAIRFDVRWMDIDSEVKLNGDKVGTAEIDPWVFGISYVFDF